MIHLPDEFVRPNYDGETIANIPATVAGLLEVPFAGVGSLRMPLWEPLRGDVKRVVLLLLDSVGWNLVQEMGEELAWLRERAVISGRVTSVFPSTTVAALSSLWTGVGPAGHGLVGLRMFFPEYAVLGQMLKLSPTLLKRPGALVDAGLEPESFLQAPGFAEQLAASGIPTHAFKGYQIVDSALSQMHSRGVTQSYGIVTAADMFVQMRELLERTAGERLYAAAYWPAVDTLSHRHGFDHATVKAELRSVLHLLETELWQPLSGAGRAGTVLLLTADHGQVKSPPARYVRLRDHPALQEMLLMRPAGEPRTAYFYARQGYQDDVIAYVNERLSHAMVAFPAGEAVADGLLGPYPHAAQTRVRVGDVIVTMRGDYLLLTPEEEEKAPQMIGRHGGMTAAEMEVPWLGFRLDG